MESGKQHAKRVSQVMRAAGLGIVATAIFLFGVGVGNGKIPIAFRQASLTQNAANKNLPEDIDYTTIEEVYDTLRRTYDGELDMNKLLDGLKGGLAEATGDPYTQYFSSSEAQDFNDQISGSFSGIGAELGKDEDKNIIIVSPIKDSPAEKAGIRAKDIVMSINDESTAGMNIDTAVSKIRGEKGTEVSLRILRDKKDDLTIKITRDTIKIDSVKWQMLDGKIGYIAISQFSENTSSLMERAAADLTGQGATSILLDLRGNPGGLLTSATAIADLWLPSGKTIVQEKRGNVVVDTAHSMNGGAFVGMKTVVLINGGSASASEIVAGALKDNGAATLIGEKSYGKGSVQQIEKFTGGSELKVTMARWYRPNGENIDKKGISPDQEIKLSNEDFEAGRDPQKDAAIKLLLGQ